MEGVGSRETAHIVFFVPSISQETPKKVWCYLFRGLTKMVYLCSGF